MKDKISKLIQDYYEKKLDKVNWRGDSEFEDDIRSVIDELDETISDLLNTTEKQIDARIEEWEADYLPSCMEEMSADMDAREEALAEIARCW